MRCLALIAAMIVPLSATWLKDLEAGKKRAAEEEKDLYLIFTAMKVSGACMQLERRVLSQESFQSAVEQDFVLVHLDVPLDQAPGMVDPLVSNKITANRYGIESYPTALYLNQEGHVYLREPGALTAGPGGYATHLLAKSGQQAAREQALEEAGKKQGLARAEAIVEVLASAPSTASPKLYEKHLKELSLSDPDDSLGFQRKYRAEVGFRELEAALRETFHKNSYEEVVKLVDGYVAGHEPGTELLQKALFRKLAAQRHGKMTEEAIRTAGEIMKAGPESSHGRFAQQILESLKQ